VEGPASVLLAAESIADAVLAGQPAVGLARLARAAGLRIATLRAAIKRLRACGWITVEPGVGSRVSVYTLSPALEAAVGCRS
jgi:DNA-binding GntR family transcriptional regulator